MKTLTIALALFAQSASAATLVLDRKIGDYDGEPDLEYMADAQAYTSQYREQGYVVTIEDETSPIKMNEANFHSAWGLGLSQSCSPYECFYGVRSAVLEREDGTAFDFNGFDLTSSSPGRLLEYEYIGTEGLQFDHTHSDGIGRAWITEQVIRLDAIGIDGSVYHAAYDSTILAVEGFTRIPESYDTPGLTDLASLTFTYDYSDFNPTLSIINMTEDPEQVAFYEANCMVFEDCFRAIREMYPSLPQDGAVHLDNFRVSRASETAPVSAVPLPASAWLLGAALLGLSRRRKS